MAELADYGIDITTLRKMYAEYEAGVSKSELEREYLHKPESHGKLFSNLVRRYLGIDTERRAAMAKEVTRLQALVRSLGADPRRVEQTQRLRQSSNGSAEFYRYGDFPLDDFAGTARRALEEIARPLAATPDADVIVTIEVRAILTAAPAELQGEVLAAAHDIGFSTAVFEAAEAEPTPPDRVTPTD